MLKQEKKLNTWFVDTFNRISKVEQRALNQGILEGISLNELHTIEAIGIEGPQTMSEVAARLLVTVGTLTISVNRLVKKGFVWRYRPEDDRRVVMVLLTEKGKDAYKLHQDFHGKMMKSVLAGLDKNEEKVLLHTMEKIHDFFVDLDLSLQKQNKGKTEKTSKEKGR